MSDVGGRQLIPQAFERAQLRHAVRGVAAIEPLESDQALFLSNRTASLGEHQLQRGPQARLVKRIHQVRQMKTEVGRPSSNALHR